MDRLRLIRRATQIGFTALVFILPVFNILRYDTATHELWILGNVWTLGLGEGFYADREAFGASYVALKFFLNAILPWLLVLAFFPLMGFLLGRFFCGWLCPEGAFFELADYFTQKITGRRGLFGEGGQSGKGRPWYTVPALLCLLLFPPVIALFLSGYFVAPSTVWRRAAEFEFSTGVKAAIAGSYVYVFATSVLLRHVFCKYICAAGLMQMLFGWTSPVSLRIRFHREDFSRCTDCKGCEQVCFMGVKPRHPRRDINCVNCGECISACGRELGQGCGLFSLGFGKSSAEGQKAPAVVLKDRKA